MLLFSYLLGSIPTGYIICRFLKGIDIRTVGSGNIGATNVARVVGKKWGIITLILDMLKGFIAVVMARDKPDLLRIGCALAVICGHNWTVFLRFRGGKGVATTAGALIGLLPNVFLSCLCIWLIVFIITKYVSLASIIAGISLPIFLTVYKEPKIFQILGVVLSVVGILRHKENIKRLLKGEEKRFKL